MQYLDKNAILGTTLRTAEVEVEEWGGTVRIQEPTVMTASLIANMPKDTPTGHKTAWWVVMCVINGDGEREFTADDVPLLAEKSNQVVSYLANEIMDLFSLSAKKARSEATNAPASD